MIGWRHDETGAPLLTNLIRGTTQRGRPALADVPRTGSVAARRTPRRRQAHLSEDIATLVSAIHAAQSETDVCQTAVDGLQTLLPGFEVELRLAAARCPTGTNVSAAEGPRWHAPLPETWQRFRPTPQASGRYTRLAGPASTADRPMHLARLSIPIALDGVLLGQLILGRLAGGSAFDSDTAALSQTIAGTLAYTVGYLRLRAQMPAGAPTLDASPDPSPSATMSPQTTPQNMLASAKANAVTWASSAFDAVADGVVILDAQGCVVLANAAFRTWFGLQRDPVGGSGAALLEHVARHVTPADDTVAHGTAPGSIDARTHRGVLQQHAPCYRVLEHRVHALPATGDQSPRTLLIYRDITREHDERERRDAFLTNVAHELRTPLTCIAGHAQLLTHRFRRQVETDTGSSGQSLTAEQWQQLAVRPLLAIQRQIKRVNRLLGDVLDMSRLDEGILHLHVTETDAVMLAAAVIDDLRTTTRLHQITLEAPPSLTLHCDADRVEQIIYNLVSNAIKYSPHGGEVRVALQVDVSDTPSLSLRVSDQGVGIPPNETERIFMRYARADTPETLRTAGIGLGLHISRALAQRHGGALRAIATGDPGATFELRLPLSGPEFCCDGARPEVPQP